MAAIERTASGTWRGDLKTGSGTINATSGVLRDTPSATRRVSRTRAAPIPRAHCGRTCCVLQHGFCQLPATQGHRPLQISTRATISLENGAIDKMHLVTQGQVPGMSEAAFKQHAAEAEKKCPVSNLLRTGLKITLDAALLL